MNKHQLRESVDYIEIERTRSQPTKLDKILERRMEDFLSKRLEKIKAGGSALVCQKSID